MKKVLDTLLRKFRSGKRAYWILLDPDDFSCARAAKIAATAEKECGADAVLIGGSLLHTSNFDGFVDAVRKAVSIPVILFPGDATQLSANAHGLLYLSLVSGRNPVNLIGEHVKAAPVIRRLGLEPIPTAYLLVESGTVTSVEFMSNTRPLPREKAAIAAAHALAASYMGMRLVYLEAGSGARLPVPPAMVRKVKECVDIPVIVGGGIRDAKTARAALSAGADIIVTGNLLRLPRGLEKMRSIATVVRSFI